MDTDHGLAAQDHATRVRLTRGLRYSVGVWRAWLIVVAICAAVGGCINSPPAEVGVWSEFLPYGEVQAELATLVAYDADLYVAVTPDTLGDALWELCNAARAAGVDVRLWLQLPAQGVWLNEENIGDFVRFTGTVLDAAVTAGVPVEWLIFDLEPALAYAETLRDTIARDPAALLSLLGEHRDPAAFVAAQGELRALVDTLHDRDVQVMAVTLPWIVDDLLDGDVDIQDIFDTPLAGLPWDQVCVMVYRPTFAEMLGVELCPGFVGSYAATVREIYGPGAQVAIGNVGQPGLLVAPGYAEPAQLAADVAAARSAGVTSISVYALDGMVAVGDVAAWLAAVAGETPRVIDTDPLTGLLRQVIGWLDRAADGWDGTVGTP